MMRKAEEESPTLLPHRIHPPHILTLPLHTLLSFVGLLHYIFNVLPVGIVSLGRDEIKNGRDEIKI